MTNWKVNALWHLVLYVFDMAIAIAGFTYGFGLEVKNWWAVIGRLSSVASCSTSIRKLITAGSRRTES